MSKRSDLVTRVTEAGSPWFTPGSLAFFNSRVESRDILLVGPDTVVFVSSEQDDGGLYGEPQPRLYSVRTARFFRKEGTERVDIDTVGDFQGYATRNDAMHAARSLVKMHTETRAGDPSDGLSKF